MIASAAARVTPSSSRSAFASSSSGRRSLTAETWKHGKFIDQLENARSPFWLAVRDALIAICRGNETRVRDWSVAETKREPGQAGPSRRSRQTRSSLVGNAGYRSRWHPCIACRPAPVHRRMQSVPMPRTQRSSERSGSRASSCSCPTSSRTAGSQEAETTPLQALLQEWQRTLEITQGCTRIARQTPALSGRLPHLDGLAHRCCGSAVARAQHLDRAPSRSRLPSAHRRVAPRHDVDELSSPPRGPPASAMRPVLLAGPAEGENQTPAQSGVRPKERRRFGAQISRNAYSTRGHG
jgi:hypothetical protein